LSVSLLDDNLVGTQNVEVKGYVHGRHNLVYGRCGSIRHLEG